jgi:hypothetical protein
LSTSLTSPCNLQEQQKKRQEQWALWEKRLQEEVRKERLNLFKKMDADKSHPKLGLNLNELRAVLEDHGDYTDDAALKTLFEAMDADGNGDISFEEASAYEDKPVVSEPITWESVERAASSAAAVAAAAASSAAAVVSEGASAAAAAASEATAVYADAAAAAAAEATSVYEVCRVADSFRSGFYTSVLFFPKSRSASFSHPGSFFFPVVALTACQPL